MDPTRRYYRYLEGQIPVPRTTRWRRRKKSEQTLRGADIPVEINQGFPDQCNITELDTEVMSDTDSYSSTDASTIDTVEIEPQDGLNDYSSDNNSDICETDCDSDRGDILNHENFLDPVDQSSGKDKRVPLYGGARITRKESDLLILSFAFRHKISDRALEDLMDLIDCHLPENTLSSRYSLKKKFPTATTMVKKFYCPSCSDKMEFRDDAIVSECGQCKGNYNKNVLENNGNYFIYMSLKDQLQPILNSDLYNKLKKPNSLDSDIVNAAKYQRFLSKIPMEKYFVTLQWNTDGVQVFNSTKLSIWPLQVVINELPYKLRRENIMLCALWYGSGKPKMTTFLEPFIEELNTLGTDGMYCQIPGANAPVHLWVYPLICTVDSIARPLLQNMVQFNGKYGCPFCYHPGERVAKGRGFCRIYSGGSNIARTAKRHIEDCEHVITLNRQSRRKVVRESFHGVKGPSSLMLLHYPFNIITSFSVDYLHSVLEGVVKSFVEEWFSPSNHSKVWYLGGKVREFDSKLLTLKPPSEITRTPRSIKERKFWKASEWRSFLLYYSLHCISELLPEQYVNHWLLLVYSIYTFLQECISEEEIEKCRHALEKFVRSVDVLYSPNCVKFNVHLLVHIPSSVSLLGALWAHSTFPFEHYNGVLKGMLKGSMSVPQQICNLYARFKMVSNMSKDVFLEGNCSPVANELYTKLLGKYQSNQSFSNQEGLRLFGAPQLMRLDPRQKVELERLVGQEVFETVKRYRRFIYGGSLYHASSFKSLTTRENSTTLLKNGELITINEIVCAQTVDSHEDKCVVLGHKLLLCNKKIALDRSVGISSACLMQKIQFTNKYTCLWPLSIHRKCVRVDIDENHAYIIPLVNSMERD